MNGIRPAARGNRQTNTLAGRLASCSVRRKNVAVRRSVPEGLQEVGYSQTDAPPPKRLRDSSQRSSSIFSAVTQGVDATCRVRPCPPAAVKTSSPPMRHSGAMSAALYSLILLTLLIYIFGVMFATGAARHEGRGCHGIAVCLDAPNPLALRSSGPLLLCCFAPLSLVAPLLLRSSSAGMLSILPEARGRRRDRALGEVQERPGLELL